MHLADSVAKTTPEPQFAAHEIFWTDAPSFTCGANREADRCRRCHKRRRREIVIPKAMSFVVEEGRRTPAVA